MKPTMTFDQWFDQMFAGVGSSPSADPMKYAASRELMRRAWKASREAIARADLLILADSLDALPFEVGTSHERTCSAASTALRQHYEETRP